MLKKSSFALIFLFVLSSCLVQRKVLEMDDWYAFTKTNTAQQKPSAIYEFKDGMIRMHGNDNSCLMTKKSYKNFELELEYRWNLEEQYKTTSTKKQRCNV